MAEHAFRQFIANVKRGDADAVLDLLRAHPEVVSICDADCFGATPLIHAVNADNRAMVDLLLDHGADVNQRSDWWAGSFGVLDSASDEMARHLLMRGATLTPHAAARVGMIDELRKMLDADPSLVHARGGDGQLPLHFSRTVEIARLLLERGAAIDALDIDHDSTAAQYLATSKPEIAAFLVAQGAKVDPFLCTMIGDVARLDTLVRNDPDGANIRVSRGRCPAAPPAAGHIYIYTIGEGCTLLHAAVNAENVESVRWLLAHGADVNARGGYDDQTPLHAAAWKNAVTVAPLLIEAGANIDARSGSMHRNQPLGWAIGAGSEQMVRLLLDAGAALHPHHREDAITGAKGAFREFNRNRTIEAWARIEKLIAARSEPR